MVKSACDRMGRIRMTGVAAVCAALVVGGLRAAGVTYYAAGGGTENSFSYDWRTADNWRLDGANGTQIPKTPPQEDDIVVFDKKIDKMSGAPDGALLPALRRLQFNVANTIHQGYICLKTGGEGLVMKDGIGNMRWWAGLRLVGDGEVPIHVPTGQSFSNQKGVLCTATATLVKTGGGIFTTASEGKSPYEPKKTILRGGTFRPRVSGTSTGHEFVWGSNDDGLRLELVTSDKDLSDPSWTIKDGSMVEAAEVANTAHGIGSSHTECSYLRLTGTPKLAEQRFTGQLYGMGGIDFAPGVLRDDGSDFLFTIAKSVSAAGGGLKVANGTLRLVEGASFTGLKLVSVGAGGTFQVASGSGAGFFCSRLDVATGGRLDLGTDVALQFQSVYVDGLRLPSGTYAHTAVGGATAVDWIVGDGRVTIGPVRIVDPIVLTVTDGATQTLEEALAAYNAAHAGEDGFVDVTEASLNGGADKARTLVKEGSGTLFMANAIGSYVGGIDVRAGILKCGCAKAFGEDVETAIVSVHAGAMVLCEMTADNRDFNVNRTFHIAGTGVNNQGALRTGNVHITYGTENAFGKHLVLEGDALVTHGPWYFLPNADVTLNGFTLTYKPISGNDQAVFFPTVNDDGKIVLDGSQNRASGFTWKGTSPDNVFEIKNNGGWRFWSTAIAGAGRDKWTFRFVAGTCKIYGDRTQQGREQANGNNTFWNPWEIASGATVELLSQGNTEGSSIYLRGPVSGGGGFKLQDGNTREPRYLHLLNPANTFSGSVIVDRGIVDVYGAGTLPKAAKLVLDRAGALSDVNKEATPPAYYGAAFMTAETQDLGACELKGTQTGRVQGGLGRFTTVEKSGPNTIEYFTQLGGAKLDVQAGTLKLPRGPAPGLWEGTNWVADAAAAFAGTATGTNLVMRGPHTANELYTENFTPSASKRLMTYTGYIWNRGNADATWTFVSSVNGPVKVKIDGEEVLATMGGTLKKVQKTLTPGPHAFEYRSYNGSPRTTDWVANLGFAYDMTGTADPAAAACVRCVDPGDGSLFTRSTDTADLPAFDAIHVANGATLDINGNRYVAADISGAGTVASTAADATAAPVLVAEGMTADLSVDETLKVDVPLAFGKDFRVRVTNVAQSIRGGKRVLLVAQKGVVEAPVSMTAECVESDSRWAVSLAADGKSVVLARTGMMMIVR